jgi:hypothetical protein
MKRMGGRAVAIRSAPVKTRRNSFAGLVMLNRRVAAREAGAVRMATVQQTMPGSIRQSARLDRDEPDRLVRRVGMLVVWNWKGVETVGFLWRMKRMGGRVVAAWTVWCGVWGCLLAGFGKACWRA